LLAAREGMAIEKSPRLTAAYERRLMFAPTSSKILEETA